MMRRLKGGEAVDLVVMASRSIDELARLGKVVPGSRVDYVRSGIGIAVAMGAARPDIGSSEAVKRAVLAARSIAYSTGPSGVYLADLFQRMGIAEAIRERTRIARGEPVGNLVARGEAEIGFQQISELLPVAGIRLLGPLPADIQEITVFSFGLHVAARDAAAVNALVRALTAAPAAPIVRRHGLEPA
jgi:molybdate transport system substrate-binding protein